MHSSKSYRGKRRRARGWGFTLFLRHRSNALSTSPRSKMTRWNLGVFFTSMCRFDLPIQFDSRSLQPAQTAPLPRRLAVRSGLYRNVHPRGRSRTRGSIRELISVDNRVRSLIFTVTGCDSVQVANNNYPGLFLTTFTCHQT